MENQFSVYLIDELKKLLIKWITRKFDHFFYRI